MPKIGEGEMPMSDGNVSRIEELGQCSELVGSIAKAMSLVVPKMTKEARQSWIGLPPADFAHVLEEQVFLPSQEVQPASAVIICPDRTNRPNYPDWAEKVMYPELELTGPAEYNISQVELWFHQGQKNGRWVKGQVIYEYLCDNQMLISCLGLADLLAIQAKGIGFFRKHFKANAVFGWKSVVRIRDGNRRVPSLYEDGGKVVLRWRWLGNDWYAYHPALRFAS